MTITLTFGTWMIPFGITILSHIIALVVSRLFNNVQISNSFAKNIQERYSLARSIRS